MSTWVLKHYFFKLTDISFQEYVLRNVWMEGSAFRRTHVNAQRVFMDYAVNFVSLFYLSNYVNSRSQWLRGLRRRSAAARLLTLWVRIPQGQWMFVCCECCVLSGRSLCDELVTRPEESYRLWCLVVCDLQTSRMWRPWPALGHSATKKKKNYGNIFQVFTAVNWKK